MQALVYGNDNVIYYKNVFKTEILKIGTAFTLYQSVNTLGLRDKKGAISQATFSNAFSWMKMYEFWLKFHCSLDQLTISSTGSDNGLAPSRCQAIIWTSDGYFTDTYMHHWASMSYNGWPVGFSGKWSVDTWHSAML